MRFWLKIGLLGFVAYLGYNGSLLLQDRQDRHQMVTEVEAVTRVSFREVQSGCCTPQTMAKLSQAQHRLATADARWERDAHHLLLLSN